MDDKNAESLEKAQEPPDGLRVAVGITRGSEAERPIGVRPAHLAQYLGCTKGAIEPLLGEPVGEYYLNGRLYPIYDWRLALTLADHPRVRESRKRRSLRMTPKKRQNLLAELVASWDISDAYLEGVVVAGYKSIHVCDIPLGGCSVLIGPNGAGKTNLLEAIAQRGKARAVFERLRSVSDGAEADRATEGLRLGLVYELGRQDEDALQKFLDRFLTGIPDPAVRDLLQTLLGRPTVVTWTGERYAELAVDLRQRSGVLDFAGALSGAEWTDPWVTKIANSFRSPDPPFHRAGPLPFPHYRSLSALPVPEIQDLHGSPEPLLEELLSDIGTLADRLVKAGFVEGAVSEVDREDRSEIGAFLRTLGGRTDLEESVQSLVDLFGSEAPWVRWLEQEGNHGSESVVNACRAEGSGLTLGGPSGRARWIVAGVDSPELRNVLVAADSRDEESVIRLLLALFLHALNLAPGFENASPEVHRLVGEVVSIGRALGLSLAPSPVSHDSTGWLKATPYGATLRSEVLETIRLIEERSNALAPPFVQSQGRITLNALSPTAWIAAGRRLSIGLLTSSHVYIDLVDTGRGAQRWIAATIREAIRQLNIEAQQRRHESDDDDGELVSPLPVRLLLVDEPEVSLHPEAQDQVAEWVSGVAGPLQRVLVATHSPSMLELSPEAATILRTSLVDGRTVVESIEVDALVGLDRVADAVGLGRSGVLLAVRGFAVLEGPSDVAVIKACIGKELARQRIVPIPVHGTGGSKALVQPEFLAAVGKPIALMFDDVRDSFLRWTLAPETQEERTLLGVRELLQGSAQVTLVPFEAPDIICGLPEAAVRRLHPDFSDWDSLVEEWETSIEKREGTNFKTYALKALGRHPHSARQFIDEVLEMLHAADPFPKTIVRAGNHLLAWSESIASPFVSAQGAKQ